MCLIVLLHYALRAALLQLDRLKEFKLVKVECSVSCTHVVEVRVIFTSAQQQRASKDSRGEALVIHIIPPQVARKKSMKPATVARCSMANEILRRRKQSGRESTRRPRLALETRTQTHDLSVQELAATHTGTRQGCKRARAEISPHADFSTAHQKSGVATTCFSTDPPDHPQLSPATKTQVTTPHDPLSDIATVADCENTADASGTNPHQRQSSMWRTGLLYLDRGDSAIIAALKDAGFNTQQTPGSPNRRFSQSSDTTHSREHSRDGRFRPDPIPAQQWVMPADTGLKFSPARVKPVDDVIDNFSPTSDTTLFEEPPSYSLDRIVEDEGFHDYFSYDGKDKDDKDACAKSDFDDQATTIQKRRTSIRRQRAPSTPSTPSSPVIKSAFGSVRRLSRELPVRAKTSEGLLQLQANPSKPHRPTPGHQRRISLGLPIKAPNAQPETHQPPISLPSGPRSAPLSRPNRASEIPSPTALSQQERDLEYKHRHTFIGTASLDDFLEVLEVSPTHMATKAAVAKAFIILAASERLLARQASSNPAGWDLVPRVTPDVPNYDYVAQAHVRLGSITLWQFLELMPFDEREEAGAMSVVEAFSAASHMDAKAGVGIANKARAFRSWMVKQANSLS